MIVVKMIIENSYNLLFLCPMLLIIDFQETVHTPGPLRITLYNGS